MRTLSHARPATWAVLLFALLLVPAGDMPAAVAARSAAPPPPALLDPPEGARLSTLGAELRWSNPPGATQYYLEVMPAPSVAGGPPDGPAITLVRNTETAFTLQPPVMGQGNYVLLPDMTYTWRVRVSDKDAFAPPGDPSYGPPAERRFRTPPVSSDGIQAVAPPEGGGIDPAAPVLQWQNSHTAVFYYEVQVSEDRAFNTDPGSATAAVAWELIHGGVSSPLNSYRVPPSFPLAPETTYHWRVRPRIQGDGAPAMWSRPFSFRTGSPQVSVVPAFPNLNLRELTDFQQPASRPDRIFVSEQMGRVRIFANSPDVADSAVFLDITDRVSRENNEEGLLGLAFHPDYAGTGWFYVYYSAAGPRRNVLSRFTVRPDNPDAADPDSELVLLESPKPFGNHNGGQIAFGPDGGLYVGIGDGGGGGDPFNNAQNLGTILGKILRLDVLSAPEEGYRVPGDNPFVGVPGAREEVWAYGLRNPWRFSFDPPTGRLWAADVGQNQWEEVDLIGRGLNYGWKVMEGMHCFAPSSGCDQTGLELPVAEYGRDDGCSVTGGYVYRGQEIPLLAGGYLYGDYCSGKLWGLWYRGPGQEPLHMLLADTNLNLTSFGRDLAGGIYLLSRNEGIYRLNRGG